MRSKTKEVKDRGLPGWSLQGRGGTLTWTMEAHTFLPYIYVTFDPKTFVSLINLYSCKLISSVRE